MECVPDLTFLQIAAASHNFNKMIWHNANAAAATGGNGSSGVNSGTSGSGNTGIGNCSTPTGSGGGGGGGGGGSGGGGSGGQSPAVSGSSNSSTMKQRKTNFTSREVEALLAAVANRKDTVLFGVAGGIGWARAWHEVAQQVSSVEGIHRSESDVRKKWTYLKWEAKNTSKPGRDPTSRAVLEILTSRDQGAGQQQANSLLEQLLVPGGGSGSPSSPGSVPIAPKKLSSMVPSSSSLPATLPTASPSSSVPPPPPEVCLRWNSYHSNMQATFPTLLNNEQFVDVTLACEGRSIKCHKVMLSACSSYFEELLSQNPCQHPIVFMRDLKFWEVQALVEFMYSGEVNVAQEKLPSLLAAAEALQIKGLTGPTQSSPQEESDYMPVHDSDEAPMSQTHKRVRKRKSTNPMAYPSRQPQQQLTKQMPMMHPIAQHSNNPLSSGGGVGGGGGIAQHPSPNRKESTSSYHPPVKIKKERESTPPLALIKEEPLDLGKDSMETGSNNGQDLSNASSSYQASNYDRSHYSGRSLGKPQNGLSDEEDQDRSSTHSNHSDETISPIEQKHDPGDDVSDV